MNEEVLTYIVSGLVEILVIPLPFLLIMWVFKRWIVND